MADIRDILDLNSSPSSAENTKEATPNDKLKKKVIGIQTPLKVSNRPEGMSREVFALLYYDKKDAPPVFPTTTGTAYKPVKAKLSVQNVRPWKWTPFTNPARTDGAQFHHWRRVADADKEYQFAKFNKQVPIITYNAIEYQKFIDQNIQWSKEETDHLFDLCRRFDLRFVIIHDRWDTMHYKRRTIEELKERYYFVNGALIKARSGANEKVYVFDADHEQRRKDQLKRLHERTPEQIAEEVMLVAELKKIDARKKERERKQQDLQKLISAADSQQESRKTDKKAPKRKCTPHQFRPRIDLSAADMGMSGIKFLEHKTSGIAVRSQRMKLPVSVGLKKTKAIEQLLQELTLEMNPVPTEDIVKNFNELRSDMVLLYELKMALATCEYDIEALRHQYEALNPGKTLIVSKINHGAQPKHVLPKPTHEEVEPPEKLNSTAEIDVVGSLENSTICDLQD